MIPQTATAIQYLKEAGIPRKQFRVITPLSKTKQRYLKTRILLYQPFRELQPYLEHFSRYFKVAVYFFENAPFSCTVQYAAQPGLYTVADRQEVPVSVKACTETRLEQLALFSHDTHTNEGMYKE